MRKINAIVIFILALSGCSAIQEIGPLPTPRNEFTHPFDGPWSFEVNSRDSNQTRCISPAGEFVGDWRSCRTDKTCGYRQGIANMCRLIYMGIEGVPRGDELIVIKGKLDQAMKTTSMTDSDADCTIKPACQAVVDAAAKYVGVSADVVASAVAQVQQTKVGAVNYFNYALPAGYQYCRVMVETVSVMPSVGTEAPIMDIKGVNLGLRVKINSPNPSLNQNRGWVESNFLIVGVRNEVVPKYHANGVCKDRYIRAVCSGAEGLSNSYSACGVRTD